MSQHFQIGDSVRVEGHGFDPFDGVVVGIFRYHVLPCGGTEFLYDVCYESGKTSVVHGKWVKRLEPKAEPKPKDLTISIKLDLTEAHKQLAELKAATEAAKPAKPKEEVIGQDPCIRRSVAFRWPSMDYFGNITKAVFDGTSYTHYEVLFYAPGLGRVISDKFPASALRFTV